MTADERRGRDPESVSAGDFMKFYDCATAPSPRRVRIFLAEKGLAVPTVQVDLRNGEQFTPAFRALNPDCMVPVLELDSGAAITDIIAICRYLEELHPDPRLMGRSAEDRAAADRVGWHLRRPGGFSKCHSWSERQSPAGSGILRTDSGAGGARPCPTSAFLCMARRAPRRQ